jgi:hypothetical protein
LVSVVYPLEQFAQTRSVVVVPAVETYWPAVHVVHPVQVTPFPWFPAEQLQVNDPAVFVQVDVPDAQLFVPAVHSFTSLQTRPLPVKPGLHVQVREPAVLAQVASAEQPLLPDKHSSTSAQEVPLPV